MTASRDYRAESRARWAAAARGWGAHRAAFARDTMPVSARMVELVRPQPGHVVLELAAGAGETGFLAAELIAPGGWLISTDFAPEMLTLAQERGAQLGLGNVRFRLVDAESVDQPAASVDAVLCRWGYMLMADPGAALRETRRILRPGGRLALAAWAARRDNPWIDVPLSELERRGFLAPPPPGAPDQFAWADPERIAAELFAAGFLDAELEEVSFPFRYASFAEFWDTRRDMSRVFADALAPLDADAEAAVREAVAAALAPWTQPGGALVLPARTWVAAAAA